MLNIPKNLWPRITRDVALSMPDLPMCKSYIRWIEAEHPNSGIPFSLMLEELGVWRNVYGGPALQAMVSSFILKGHPAENSVFTHYVRPSTEPDPAQS